MILLALCLIQASAGNYYYKILLYPNVRYSDYIEVTAEEKHDGQKTYYVYHNGLRDLINGKTVTDVEGNVYTLTQKDPDIILGIAFANEKGIDKGEQSNIMEGDEYEAWKEIRSHIKYH